jgi:HEPN domain-containing protein
MNNERKELESQVYRWIEIAEEDLLLAKHAFSLKSNIPYRLICYHAQQCAEKYIKAFLVSKFIDFPYTHSINALIKLVPQEFNLITTLESAFTLTNYAVARRYPGEYQDIKKDDAINSVKLAELVKKNICELLEKDDFNFIKNEQ